MDAIATQPFQKFQKKKSFSNLDNLATIDTCPNPGIYAKIDSAKFGKEIVPHAMDTLTGNGDSATNLATACHAFDTGNVPPKKCYSIKF
jgi:hypothetical protein